MVYNTDECHMLGKRIQAERKRQGLTQEQLAQILGISRVMVTEMETHGKGLRDTFTRRDIAKALGISPLVLGVLGADAKPEVLYDIKILQKSFQLHIENYYTTGSVTLPDIDEMVDSIFTISKSLDHKDKNVLTVLHAYTWLGIALSRETLDALSIEKYIAWSMKLSKELADPIAIARSSISASSAMYALGDYERASYYAQNVAKMKRVPSHVQGQALLEVGIAENNPHMIDTTLTLVQNKPREEDVAYVKLSTDICQIRKAMVLLNNGDVSEAESFIADAEDNTPMNMVRRQCMIQWLRARLALQNGEFDEAAITTLSAVPLAKQINSQQNLERLRGIHAGLLESSYANSRNVKLIGTAL